MSSQPSFLTSITSPTPSASSAGAVESGFVTKAWIRPQNLRAGAVRPAGRAPWMQSVPSYAESIRYKSLPFLTPLGIRPSEYPHPKRLLAPLAVPYAGEAQLDVLSRGKRVEEAAALVPLGGAGKG